MDGTLEKDINLEIALLLKELLEKESIETILTRTEDKAVGQEGEKGSKQEDMKKRVEIINESGAALAVSIHQNSFTEASSRGAQVFYHTQSDEGAVLAKMIQEKIKASVKDENHRMEKANDSYYLLKKTNCPIVIVECGFLSNYEEAVLLNDCVYQKKIAEGIAEGVKWYLQEKEEKSLSTLEKISQFVGKTR